MAIVGLGYWGPNLVRNFNEVQGAELRTVCDADPSRTEVICRRYPHLQAVHDVGELLEDPQIDAVGIATPVATHHALVKAALQAGKHVLVEKPLAASVREAEDLVDTAERAGRVLMVDHVFLYSPPVRKMKEIVDRGELGRLQFIDSVRINLGLIQNDVNVIWDLACHDLSIVDYLVGRLPKSVSAFGTAHTPGGLEDVAYMNLDFGDHLIANFHVNWLSPVKIRYSMLGGSNKSLIYNDLDPMERIKLYDSGVDVQHDPQVDRARAMVDYRMGDVWSPHLDRAEPLHVMASHFIDCVAGQKRPLTDGHAGLRVVRILEAAQHSIKAQGGRITL